jgi:hypothetical protein
MLQIFISLTIHRPRSEPMTFGTNNKHATIRPPMGPYTILSGISGSSGGDYEYDCLLRLLPCGLLENERRLERLLLPPSSDGRQ